MTINIYNADCLIGLQSLPDNSVHAIVTDPPYGMSNHTQKDIIDALTSWLKHEEYKHTKRGFMNNSWDGFVPSPIIWEECLRVLRPGGHLFCFASTRTLDLMGISLRIAGFEIRDSCFYCFGGGFPKSLSRISS